MLYLREMLSLQPNTFVVVLVLLQHKCTLGTRGEIKRYCSKRKEFLWTAKERKQFLNYHFSTRCRAKVPAFSYIMQLILSFGISQVLQSLNYILFGTAKK